MAYWLYFLREPRLMYHYYYFLNIRVQNGKTCRAQDEGKVNEKELKGDMNVGGDDKNKNSAPTHFKQIRATK